MNRIQIRQLADAFEAVARANHYMVGIIELLERDDLDAAEQILITRQSVAKAGGAAQRRLSLALDLIGLHRDMMICICRASRGEG